METADIILAKAKFEDWKSMYRNIWSRPESAQYMQWNLTQSEEDARRRIERTIEYQKAHDTYIVYEKRTGEAIGFAGVEEIGPGIFREAGIALGPEYVGRGYGKQILNMLMAYCVREFGARTFYYSTWDANAASKALALSCGFSYMYSEPKVDQKTGRNYKLETYSKRLVD